ncbi:GGDEF domain-containing protein [Candidatus Sumerlaeota bacterium]|nr:GGDEF domain-containing protein [Candidatus Sumerlaeota bacterium]
MGLLLALVVLHGDLLPEAKSNRLVAMLAGLLFGLAIGGVIARRRLWEGIRQVRSELAERADEGELHSLSIPEDSMIDPLVVEINSVLRAANQRLSMATALRTAARSRAAESDRDKLTGLYNRGYLSKHLADEVGRTMALGSELSLIMIDVDHFKHYNDTQGHQRGDAVLRDVADLLNQSVRSLDVCVRYGGEEFTVLLPRTPLERAKRTAERIRSAIESHVFEAGELQPGGRLTVSLGVASLPRLAQDSETLIRMADEALYAAKHAGRNRVVGADEMTSSEQGLSGDSS